MFSFRLFFSRRNHQEDYLLFLEEDNPNVMKAAIRYFLLSILFLSILPSLNGKTRKSGPFTVPEIKVSTPEGTAPRLPYLIQVKDRSGKTSLKQVRWMNSPRETEEEEAHLPSGTVYKVQGYILGDNSTENGFPVEATVSVTEEGWAVPGRIPKAKPLPLGSVHLIGENLLTSNRDLDIGNLLSLDVTQQLYNFRDTYGLSTEGYKRSDGWDSPTTKLKGHGTGHYMSAMALAYAGTTDLSTKNAIKENIRRVVDELRSCQELTFTWSDSLGRYFEARDLAPEEELPLMKGTWEAFDTYKKDCAHYGYGYIGAIPAQHAALIEMYRPYNNNDWVWAPYYTIHKILSGLVDISTYVDDKGIAGKALLIAKDMGLWVWNRMHYRTFIKTDGDRDERRSRPGNRYEMWNMYIAGEVGGMQEILSRLSGMVSDPTEKEHLLEAAGCFDSPAFYDPLSKNIDDIRTRHANQHIPMIIGALSMFSQNGDPYYYNIAENFWNMVQGRYAYATGGVGNGEMFRQPYSQMSSMNNNTSTDRSGLKSPDPTMNETCCAYNLAKLTRGLSCYSPDDARYMDYYERVLLNQIIGSLNPEEYGVCYQYAVGLNARKPFGNPTPQSSCCGGTGAENHVKYQEAAYFVGEDTIWVALYLPTEAEWEEKGVSLRQDCQFPAESSIITVTKGGRFAMKLRVPYWAGEGFMIKLNGTPISRTFRPSSYAEIPAREWKEGDKVEITMPFTKHIHFGPDKMDLAATGPGKTEVPFTPMWEGTLMYGPLVMASPDITLWEQAEFSLSPDLREVIPGVASDGTPTLTLGDKMFYPDYSITTRSTHYLRVDISGEGNKGKRNKGVDLTFLRQAVGIATARMEEQSSWEDSSDKESSSAPWAPNGYSRMLSKLSEAKRVLAAKGRDLTQDRVTMAAAGLNSAINAMRPGDLAEPEDLQELLKAVEKAEKIPLKSERLQGALRYAEMVIDYVNGGSGTKDFIERALSSLNQALES